MLSDDLAIPELDEENPFSILNSSPRSHVYIPKERLSSSPECGTCKAILCATVLAAVIVTAVVLATLALGDASL